MNLAGHILIAMPGMMDARFDKAVILIAEHSAHGAMGLVINHPHYNLMLGNVFQQMDIDADHIAPSDERVYQGGPVEGQRGFLLHTYHSDFTDSIALGEKFYISNTKEAVERLATGILPSAYRLILGYAGWSGGQLEEEILANGWLTAEASLDLVLHTSYDKQWEDALGHIGVTPSSLSIRSGRA